MGENEVQDAPLDLREQLASALADADNVDLDADPARVDDPVMGVQEPHSAEVPAGGNASATEMQEGASETPVQNPPAPESAQEVPDQMQTLMQMAQRTAEALRATQQENARLQALLDQQSAQAQEAAENVANAAPQMPILDTSGFAYMDDAAKAAAQARYAEQMMAYIRSQMEGEIAPIRESYERQRAEAERNGAIHALSNDPKFAGFADNLPQIEHVLSATPSLSGEADLQKRYAIAYLIKRGLDAVSTPAAERAAADIAKEAMGNPEVMRIIAAQGARAAEEKNADVPRQMASAGASSAPAAPISRPQNMDEAYDLMRRTFGL